MDNFKFNVGQTVNVCDSLGNTMTGKIIKQRRVAIGGKFTGTHYDHVFVPYYRIKIDDEVNPADLWPEEMITEK